MGQNITNVEITQFVTIFSKKSSFRINQARIKPEFLKAKYFQSGRGYLGHIYLLIDLLVFIIIIYH